MTWRKLQIFLDLMENRLTSGSNSGRTKDKWTRKNGKTYSAIVEEREGLNAAILVVMERKASDNAKKFCTMHCCVVANGAGEL